MITLLIIKIKHKNINCFINKKDYKLEESKVSFCLNINNFQICIENEITNSKILISTKNDLIFKINKIFYNELEKNFTMELIIKNFVFYIPPILSSIDSHIINWIGYSENNKYYLLQEKFNQIVKLPNVFLQVKEIIKNENKKDKRNKDDNKIGSKAEQNEEDEINIKSTSTINIIIDKLYGEFKKEHFNSFMDIIKVLIFNGGDSLNSQNKNEIYDLDRKIL